MRKIIMLLVAFSLIGSVVFGQTTEEYKEHSGYVDFGSFDQFQDAVRNIEVSIKGPLLKFVSKATAQEDPELSDLLDKLLLIQVNVFSVEDDQIGDVDSIIQNVSKTLASKQWERMVRVQDEGQRVEVFMQFGAGDVLNGLAVMALGDDQDTEIEEQQAVFVNIVGTFDPAQLGKLSAKFNIPKLEELEFGNTEKEHKVEHE